jgi:hypothetical protein
MLNPRENIKGLHLNQHQIEINILYLFAFYRLYLPKNEHICIFYFLV